MVLLDRIELSNSSLPMRCSTTELQQLNVLGCGEGRANRTDGQLADHHPLGNRIAANCVGFSRGGGRIPTGAAGTSPALFRHRPTAAQEA